MDKTATSLTPTEKELYRQIAWHSEQIALLLRKAGIRQDSLFKKNAVSSEQFRATVRASRKRNEHLPA